MLVSHVANRETHSELCQVEGHRVVVDDGQGPSGRAHGAAQDPPAEAEGGRVHGLAEQRDLLGMQVNQNIVNLQRRPQHHLQTRRSSGASTLNSGATVFDTDLDILDLSPVHQLPFQDLQALRSQRHNTLKHLDTPKHTCWLKTAHLGWLPLSHHAITDSKVISMLFFIFTVCLRNYISNSNSDRRGWY